MLTEIKMFVLTELILCLHKTVLKILELFLLGLQVLLPETFCYRIVKRIIIKS